MERIIVPKTTPEQESFFQKLMDTAIGTPTIFTSAPTADQMEPNTCGFYANELYYKFGNGVLLKFTGTVVS